jgi:GSH-dependent disulfide-bond oxidoreductase
MIELHTWMTDNGFKARQMVEETGVEYTLKPINLRNKEQFDPDFLKLAPVHQIPALVDSDGPGGETVTMFGSGTILTYMAQKAAPELHPADPVKRLAVDNWFYWGTSTFTPLAQQFGHYTIRSPEKVPAAQKHYEATLLDMLGIMEKQLDGNEYLAGAYSIADISCYPDTHIHGINDVGLDNFPNVTRWHDAIAARPAVQRAWEKFA